MNFILKNKTLVQNLVCLLALNFLVLMKIPYLSNFLGFIYLFILPGLLIYKLFDLGEKSFWYQVVNIVGFSVVYLMFVGFFTNLLDVLFLIPKPLLAENISISITITMMTFLYYLKNNNLFKIEVDTDSFDIKKYKFLLNYLPLILLPIISLAGTMLLNNIGVNTLVIITDCIIALLSLYLLVKNEKISENFILTAIYFIALSLLLMTSMRSIHVVGYDVNKELRVFEITQKGYSWSMDNFRDAYNACLSITILPTLVSGFINISNEYIYKFLFQVLFAVMPVSLFLFFRRFLSKNIALLSTFFCIFQTWFFQNMPALVRQEFAILFFVLIFSTIFDNSLGKVKQFLIFAIFGTGMVLSHYSTTYVAVVILLGAYIINLLFNLTKSISKIYGYNLRTTRYIRLKYIVFLVLMVLVWGRFVTNTSGNINEFLLKSTVNASRILTSDNLLQTVNTLFYPSKENTDLDSYINYETKSFKEDHKGFTYYDYNASDFAIKNTKFTTAPSQIGADSEKIALSIFKYLKIIANDIFILFGIVVLLYEWLKQENDYAELISIASVGIVFILMLIIIPGALHEYNLERLYFQLLIIWSFFGVIGGLSLLKFIVSEKKAVYIVFGMFISIFLFYTGVIFSITGGPATLSMNNYGEDFEKFYTTTQEAKAAKWLDVNHGNYPIFTNSVGLNKLNAFSLIDQKSIFRDTIPTIIPKEAFVFLTHMNAVEKVGIYEYDGTEYVYTYPNQFLRNNKDKVYSNGISEVYR